jgi:hypothetical protein
MSLEAFLAYAYEWLIAICKTRSVLYIDYGLG